MPPTGRPQIGLSGVSAAFRVKYISATPRPTKFPKSAHVGKILGRLGRHRTGPKPFHGHIFFVAWNSRVR
ncbi:hypothetical protein B0H19DRAFT_1142554 [Mycena capillaripes]|nr:hypothetical protein B0H19DRAFT_1142554 [Mycena capillaripes]